MKKVNKKLSIILTLAGPVIMIIYLTLDHFGVIDKLTNQDKLEMGVERLESTAGYPTTWLFNDSIDGEVTTQIFKLIKKNSKLIFKNSESKRLYREIINNDYPIVISTAGSAIKIPNVDESWTQEEKYFYSDNHPILIIFNAKRNSEIKATGGKVCTLGELKKWAKNRKNKSLYWIGGVAIGLFSIAIAILQYRIE